MTHRGAATKLRRMASRTALAVLVVCAILAGVVGAARTLSPAAQAAQSLFASTLNNEASLVSNVDSVAPGQPFRIGLLFGLGADWHIYWTNPGDAGAAPTMTVSLPQGGAAGAIQWPIPKVMNDGPVTSYGYTRKTAPVLLPLTITPPKTLPIASQYKVTVAATWLVCKDICVPGDATFTLTLPVAAKPVPSSEAALFTAVDRNSPVAEHWHAWIQPDGSLTVDGTGATRAALDSAYFFPLQPGEINPDYYQPLKIDRGRIMLGLKPDSGFDAHHPLAGLLALTTPDGQDSAAMIRAEPGVPPVAAPGGSGLALALASVTSAGFLALVSAALLGGLILNLMPCVFPVLAMKAAHLAHLSNAKAGQARRDGLAYGAGVLLSFGVLGGVLLALREGGSLVGWGFQFQSPLFVLAMAWLLFAVGLSFSGVLRIGGRWMGIGQGLAARGGVLGSFFTGVLAALVATPCTAPFMGTAVAAALAGPPLLGMVIFLALGLGLALPLVVLCCIPGIARIMPRPGRWMDILHQALAFPIYASVLWLVWVASREGGSTLLLAAGAGLLLIAFAAWLMRLGGRVAPGLAALAVIALVPLIWSARGARPDVAHEVARGAEAFSTARLAALRAAGKPAFVDLTAAWCVTCLLNERAALEQTAVRDGFRRAGVTYLVGDWTRADPDITAYLKSNGRDGVPLYVFYPADGGQPVTLPQILTPGLVLSTIGASAG
jgi:thiol:disulfide interchange protein/DsbC/DsbD-like thiol-disulfide interchange protein